MKPSKQKRIAVIVFLLVLLTSCAKDTEAPTISKVTVEESAVSIEATDNVGVVGYLLSNNEDTPDLESSDWQSSNTFETIKNGSYFVWVKDKAGNVTKHTDTVVVDVASEYEKNFLLATWDDREVDPALKEKYGDVYAFVEPLTKEEIEERFEFLVWFSEEQVNNRPYTYFSNYTGLAYTDEAENIIVEQKVEFYKQIFNLIYTTNNQILLKYKQYFKISPVTGEPRVSYPKSFDSLDGVLGITQKNKGNVSFEEKEFFVRYIIAIHDIELDVMKDLGLEIKYYFDDPSFNTSGDNKGYTK